MNWLASLADWEWSLFLATLCVAVAVVWALRRALPHDPSGNLTRQLATIAVGLISALALILAVPFESEETRGQLLSLFGLLVTAVIALSSTTFVSNAMAGFTLRAVAAFKPGDFIRVGEHFGRVTESALLHTEIQSEDRDLVTLPNLFVMTQPVRVIRSNGTLISANVSLGYDVDRRQAREVLKQAATDTELTDPFVQILDLGDFAVKYRISGFLKELGSLVTKRTELRSRMLDGLHANDIEIVSPSFMNQRRLDALDPVIPATPLATAASADAHAHDDHAETLMFEKAEIAARLEQFREQRDALVEKVKALRQTDASGNEIEIRWRERQITTLEEMMTTLNVD